MNGDDMKIRTFTILLVTGLAMSASGIASASNANLAQSAKSTNTQAAVTKTAKRRVIRKEVPSTKTAMPVFSDKGWISAPKTSNAKTAVLKPKTLKTRTPNLFGK